MSNNNQSPDQNIQELQQRIREIRNSRRVPKTLVGFEDTVQNVELLDGFAARLGLSRSAFLRRLLQDYIAAHPEQV